MDLKIFHILKSTVILTILYLAIFICFQQYIRLSANEPQNQYSIDIAERLSDSKKIDYLFLSDKTNLEKSLTPFIVVYNEKGDAISSTTYLNDKSPMVPSGVFEYAKIHKQNKLTWMPKPGLRFAIVVTSYKSNTGSGFVLVGRSLKEAEYKTQKILYILMAAYLITVVVVFVYYHILGYFRIKSK